MKLGVMLPTFAESAAPALEAAAAAEEAGLHGVFAYHHLWPIGHPGRPAISPFPLLGAVAVATRTIHLGTLVARVGLVREPVALGELLTLDAVSGGRFIAGVGTGDAKSAAEHVAYGLRYRSAGDRRAELEEVCGVLVQAGVTTWVGGGLPATNELARRVGATLNLWAVSPERVAAEAVLGPVSWGGPFPSSAGGGQEAAVRLLGELAEAGAGWAVFTWPGSAAAVAAAGLSAGVVPGGGRERGRHAAAR